MFNVDACGGRIVVLVSSAPVVPPRKAIFGAGDNIK